MSQIDKILKKFLKNPAALNYSQIEKILKHLGFIKIEAKGSHKKFKHEHYKIDIVIPVHNNDCKDFYKNLIAKELKKKIL